MTQRADNSTDQYGYVPTLWICILFVTLFSITTIIHLGQTLRYRLWFLLPTVVLAGLGEIIGWTGRLWSSKNPYLGDPFLMQICATIISPTPLVAANFVILGVLIRRLGPQYSRLSAKWYTGIFVSADLIALIIQAIGGASASTASQNNGNVNIGSNIMLAGIVFQLVAITIYFAFATEFIYRFIIKRPIRHLNFASRSSEAVEGVIDNRAKQMLVGLSFSTLFIFIRSIYRTIELAGGWNGHVILTERYFDWLDGAMILLAMYTINIFHPGRLLGHLIGKNAPSELGSSEENLKKMSSAQVHIQSAV